MFRRLQSNFGKTKDTTYTAGEALTKGMLVVKDRANKEVTTPASAIATGVDIYMLDFDPDYTGLLAVQENVSDYDSRMNDVADGARVALELLEVGEVYATDQYDAGVYAVGDFLQVGTDGKLEAYAGTSAPLVVYDGAYDDAGNTLLAFEVTNTPYAV